MSYSNHISLQTNLFFLLYFVLKVVVENLIFFNMAKLAEQLVSWTKSKTSYFLHSVTLVLFVIFLSDAIAMRVKFQTIQSDSKVDDSIQPFFQKMVGNMLKCYAICQRKADQCLYVEISEYNEEEWSCRLFEFIGNIQDQLRPSTKGTLVSALTLKRDCLELVYSGYTKDGVYYISFGGLPRKVFCDMTTDGGGWVVMQETL